MMLSKRPLVSVIIASYNHKDFVKEAISSVLKQSIEDIEIIVVDDGSTDGTDKVVGKINDKRLQFIGLSKNRQQHPRNLALRFAKGKYVAFQNSDDIWCPDKLALQLKAFVDNKNISACFTGVEIITRDGLPASNSWANNLFSTQNRSSTEWLRFFFDIGNCLCISSAVVRRETLKNIGIFDESLIQLSDFDLWIRCATFGDLYIISKPLTKMRIVRGRNISAPNPQAQRRANIELAQVLQRFTGTTGKVNILESFPDVCSDMGLPLVIQKAFLAQYAWTKSPAHRLFADRLFADLVSCTKHRNMITNHFGPGIFLDFIQKRSELDIVVHD